MNFRRDGKTLWFSVHVNQDCDYVRLTWQVKRRFRDGWKTVQRNVLPYSGVGVYSGGLQTRREVAVFVEVLGGIDDYRYLGMLRSSADGTDDAPAVN